MTQSQTIYFLGIGGIGMSALARLFHHRGYTVIGSDALASQITAELGEEGIGVSIGNDLKPEGIDIVVYSTAISHDNPLWVWFKQQGAEFLHRSEALAKLFDGCQSIGVTGTHGKTSTSALLAYLIDGAISRPTALIGGYMKNFQTNVLLGDNQWLVAEVDESDKSHLHVLPNYLVLTNLECDHKEVYGDEEGLRQVFEAYLAKLEAEGKRVIYCSDDPLTKELVEASGIERISYGLCESSTYRALSLQADGNGMRFELNKEGRYISDFVISLPGSHNVQNVLAAIAVLDIIGVNPTQLLPLLPTFLGVERRMDVLYEDADVCIIDDYAHHPTEIKSVLSALQQRGRRIICVFEPHRFTRTRLLLEEFKGAFLGANRLILTDIYSAWEKNPSGVSIENLKAKVQESFTEDCCILPKEDVGRSLIENHKKGDIVLFLGAGDITHVAHDYVKTYCAVTGEVPLK